MKTYTANPNTGEYESTSTATLDPVASKRLRSNVYTLPAYSTYEKPPEVGENEVAVLQDGSWTVEKDFRGTKLYSHSTKEEIEVTDIGQLPFGYSLDKPGDYDSWGANVWVTDEDAQLEGARQEKLTELREIADHILSDATSEYPAMEQASWSKQEAQAKAYLRGSDEPTILLDGIAAQRGVTKLELAGKVMQKVDDFEFLAGLVVGKRQAIEDQLLAANTLDQISSIDLTIL